MRFSNQRVSPMKKNILTPKNMQCTDYFNYKVKMNQSCFHYNNAMYMGNMISYKRNGIGIMIADEGTSAIVQNCYDSMTGHNIFIRQNSIASFLSLKTGASEIAFRTSHFILRLPFHNEKVSGSGLLIDFAQNKVYHLIFSNGSLRKKIQETNKDVLQKIFNFDFREVLNFHHQQALKLNLKFNNGIKIMKKGSKFYIGFFDSHGNFQGLGMKFSVQQESFHQFDQDLYIKSIERGYYNQNRLQNYGERYFPNGNLYLGQFSNDSFNGKGILLYPEESNGKWVYGQFQNNKLVKMLNTCLGQNQPNKKTLKAVLQGIHKSNPIIWMNVKIDLIDWSMLSFHLAESIDSVVTDLVIEKQKEAREEQQRLYLIQKHFSQQYQNNEINTILLAQKDRNQMTPEKIVVGQFNSIKTKQLNIQPRCIQNQQLWSAKTQKQKYASNFINNEQRLKSGAQKKFNLKLFYSSLEKQKSKSNKKINPIYTPKNLSPGKVPTEKKIERQTDNFIF